MEISTVSYGTETQAIYSGDKVTLVLKGVTYKDLPKDFADLILKYCQLYNL